MNRRRSEPPRSATDFAELSRRRLACALARAALRLVLRIERTRHADLALRARPRCSGRRDSRGSSRTAGRPQPRGPRMAALELRLGGPHQERRQRPSPSGRPSAWCRRVGHLAVAGQRRRHGDVEVREVRIVVRFCGVFGVRELLQSSRLRRAGLVLIAGQQRIDIGRTALARLGDQRQVRRKRIVVRRARRDLVRERRREVVGRKRLAGRRLAGVRVDRRDLVFQSDGDLLDLGLVVADAASRSRNETRLRLWQAEQTSE